MDERAPTLESLSRLNPESALLVIQCSAAKVEGGTRVDSVRNDWPPELAQARRAVLGSSGVDAYRLIPAWRRYDGHFYTHSAPSLANAVAGGHVCILSGGYGLVRAEELIGTYNRVFRSSDWPRGLLERLLIDEAHRVGANDIVAFVSATTDYARLLRRVPNHARTPYLRVWLVTIEGVRGGAMAEVPRRLGRAFAAFWSRGARPYPPGTSVMVLTQ